MPSLATVPGAAPAWVSDRVRGPGHDGRVVHAGADALYFTSFADTVGIISRRAVASPCTVETRLESLVGLLPAGVTVPARLIGSPVRIGAGRIDLGGTPVRIARFVDLRLPTIPAADVAVMHDRLADALGDASLTEEIAPELLSRLGDADATVLTEVLGRGSGLTPFGDDVVAGLVAVLRAANDPCADRFAVVIDATAAVRTTGLSATLLRRTAAGDVLPRFAAVIDALRHRPDHVPAAVDTLRRTGHTSGTGMVLGLRLALAHLTISTIGTTRSCP